MSRSQMADSAKSLGGSMNKDGTFSSKSAAKAAPAKKGNLGGHHGS
jgi:hypothetical protein